MIVLLVFLRARPTTVGATRIFSPETVPGLCVTIGRQLNESKRLTAVSARSICRLRHIRTDSSSKVVAKSGPLPIIPDTHELDNKSGQVIFSVDKKKFDTMSKQVD
jgi:hypothetical protein